MKPWLLHAHVDHISWIIGCLFFVFVFHCRDSNGDWYTYSFGGYHADDDERTVLQADSQGGPFFKSNPIDIHCCDVGMLVDVSRCKVKVVKM